MAIAESLAMQRSSALVLLLLAVGLLVLTPGTVVRAEEEPPAGDEVDEGDEQAEPLSPEEAKRLEKLLTKAAKARKVADVIQALDEVGEQSHPSFQKPLLKMLTHESSRVAMRAADQLALQQLETEKAQKKLGKAIWRKGFTDRKNHRRPNVKGRIIYATSAVEGGAQLDNNRFKDLERHWRTVIGDPRESNAPGIVAVCEYVRLAKDKRLCRMLAEEIDEPGTTAVNSPTNPPAEWWERRWKMWKQYKAEIVESLEELTGESFKDTAAAKAWFEANGKEFGFRW